MAKRQRTEYAKLAVDGLPFPVSLRRLSTARRLTLRIDQREQGVVLTIPKHCGMDEAADFVGRHLDWVKDRLSALPDPVPFSDNASLPLRGTEHLVRFIEPERGAPVVEPTEQRGKPTLLVRGLPEHAPRRLRDWLKKQARTDLTTQVSFHEKRLGLRSCRISIKDQTTRWGSCSSTGTLSFSWRLILAPEHVLDYVAAHEVAHLQEMNHGPHFWALVKKTCPDMDLSRQWLKLHGTHLHCFGQQPKQTDA